MRLRIRLQMNGTFLPYTYQRGIQAYIYSSFSYEYAQQLHEMDDGLFTPFVFSDLMGAHETGKEGILYTSTAVLFIASPYEDLLHEIFEHLTESEYMDICGNIVPVLEVKPVRNHCHDGVMTYHTLSPVTMYQTEEDGYRYYPSPVEKEFEMMLKENIIRKYEQLYHDESKVYFHFFMPQKVRKHMRAYKNFRYVCYDASFKIDTTAEIHNLILDMGLGSRNAAGFGMIEELHQKRK